MVCLLLVIFAPFVGSLSSKCGVCSNQFPDAPYAVGNATQHGMSWWWNWAKTPRGQYPDGSHIDWEWSNDYMSSEFIPMMWGPLDLSAEEVNNLRSGNYVMGFNEPDLYGPPHCGDNGGSDYRPATSCGAWEVCFSPALGAENWKKFIDQVFNPTGNGHDFSNGPKILSPAMALDATGDAALCDTTAAATMKLCPGWLLLFKQYTLNMELTKENGIETNYWDIIDYIQFHAYDYTKESVLEKIEAYTVAFQDDVDQGRIFWLTEIAGGYLAFDEQKQFMESIIPELNRIDEIYAYSWFSVWSFPSFVIDGIEPTTTTWVSNLFKIDGSLNALGELYFELCNQ